MNTRIVHNFKLIAAFLSIFFIPQGALAELHIMQPYAVAMPPGVPNTAAYMMLHNASDQVRTLVSASSDSANEVQIHAHQKDGDTLRMRPVEQVSVPANGHFQFQPGGHHLMLLGVSPSLAVGDEISLSLRFADGSVQEVSLPVQAIGQQPQQDHGSHHHH